MNTKDQAQKAIREAILGQLTKYQLSPEQGLAAMMGATMDILKSAAQVVGAQPKQFVQYILAQAYGQA